MVRKQEKPKAILRPPALHMKLLVAIQPPPNSRSRLTTRSRSKDRIVCRGKYHTRIKNHHADLVELDNLTTSSEHSSEF